VKKPRIAFSDAAIADILEQSDWYEAKQIGVWRNVGKGL
jgi:hypothetical protein